MGENRGYDQTTYTILTKNSRSILTTALYDLWILLASGEELEQKYFNGHAYSDAHHPKNQLVSASLCFHLANYQYHERWGFPDVVPAFPRLLTRSCSMPDIKDLVVKNSLVEECKRREAEARTAAMDKEIKAMEITQMASGGSPGWIATAFPSYRSAQVKELEKSNTRMKKQLKGLKESQAKMEERLNELEAWKKQIGTVFKKLGGTK